MFPDYPSIKAHVRGIFLRWAQEQVPALAPLLGEIGRFRQHEGRAGHLKRVDESTEIMEYPESSFPIEITRDEMRRLDLQGLFAKFHVLAEQLAEAQGTMMFSKVSEAVEATGNSVSAGGDFQPEHFFQMLSKIEMDFDPQTGEPRGHSWVMHPDTAAAMVPKMKAWETDPAFITEHERILALKREEWRAREDSRRLVD
jgi:hypothetical protein